MDRTVNKENIDYEKFKNRILKDTDFKNLGLKVKLSPNDSSHLQALIKKDSEFLKKYDLTDYSLLLSIHNKQERFTTLNYRTIISSDNLHIYSFSIIDFLTVFIIYLAI